jgi:hypothetical protein
MTDESDIPPCLISIDKEGRWHHKGVEMVRREFIGLFYQHMSIDSLGRYVIDWEGERCYVEVEDTAYVVKQVIPQRQGPAGNIRFMLSLSDDSLEELMPDTLFVGNDHVLYCAIRGGTFPARFSRPAYYQLAQHVEEQQGIYFLAVDGKRYVLFREAQNSRD